MSTAPAAHLSFDVKTGRLRPASWLSGGFSQRQYASGCPKLRPASAHHPLVLRVLAATKQAPASDMTWYRTVDTPHTEKLQSEAERKPRCSSCRRDVGEFSVLLNAELRADVSLEEKKTDK